MENMTDGTVVFVFLAAFVGVTLAAFGLNYLWTSDIHAGLRAEVAECEAAIHRGDFRRVRLVLARIAKGLRGVDAMLFSNRIYRALLAVVRRYPAAKPLALQAGRLHRERVSSVPLTPADEAAIQDEIAAHS